MKSGSFFVYGQNILILLMNMYRNLNHLILVAHYKVSRPWSTTSTTQQPVLLPSIPTTYLNPAVFTW